MRSLIHVLKKIYRNLFGFGIIENVTNTVGDKNCLIMYVTAPFRQKQAVYSHQNRDQVVALAEVIAEFGYCVDVIQYNDKKILLKKNYDLVIDLHPGLNKVYAGHLSPKSKRIGYITGSNPAFANEAESKRLEAVQQRRGVRLKSRRNSPLFLSAEMEALDAVFLIGNGITEKTYSGFSLKRLYLLKNTGYPFLYDSKREKCNPFSFLFLSSSGQVHKGLDLLLEIFSDEKDMRLYVCSPFQEESDFYRLYQKELTQSENIIPIGFTDINGSRFREVIQECSYLLQPSCSEGISGSVLTAMSAGLIPLVSRECGLEKDEVVTLDDCSLETIRKIVKKLAGRKSSWIIKESKRVKEIIKTRYSLDVYKDGVRKALADLLK